MVETFLKVLEQYGLAAGIMVAAVLALSWAWKKERDRADKERDLNQLLNKEMRAASTETTAALVAVKEVSEALKGMIDALDSRIGAVHGLIEKHSEESRILSEKNRESAGLRLENIEKKLIDLTARMET